MLRLSFLRSLPKSCSRQREDTQLDAEPGQRIRIVSAWRQFALFGFHRHYVVSVPGAGLPDGIPVTMNVQPDGVPDPRVYESMHK
jgi:hypothetical protein